MPIAGLIFDFDGTVADTMPLHWKAWQGVIPRRGFQFPMEKFYASGGVPSREILAAINREQGLNLDIATVAREKENAYLALLGEVRTIEPIMDIIRTHQGLLPMAVASGGTRRVIEHVLNHLNLRHFFSAVVTSDDLERPKPAPDVFLEAARCLGVPPWNCRAYEDTDLGMAAIRAAGMEAVDVRQLLNHPFC